MERFLTVFWLLLIPTQLGRHFWLKDSSVMGARVDYLSIILYLTDLVWFLWIWTQRKKIKLKFNFFSFILILFVLVNIIFAQAGWVALYKWLRIGQWWLTWQIVRINKQRVVELLKKIVPVWIIGEAFLGLAQMINGGSLNGIWWWFGERRFIYGGIGIAQMRFLDEGWIRAYGTFSHPNSLAGFLLLVWWWWKGQELNINKVLYWVVWWSAILGIAISGSRTIWILALGLLVAEQFRKEKKWWLNKRFLGKICLFSGIIMLILGMISINYRISDFVGGWDVNGFQKREMLALAAIKMVESSPLFGVGAGNFVVNLPKFQTGNYYWMQPVHNIFLLIWSEIGILGIIILLMLGVTELKSFKIKKYWWFLIIVGVTGMLDHYWLTLPQNTWLLAIILGLI